MPKTTIGVIGKGTLSSRMIRSIFADQLDTLKDAEDMRLVLPVTKGLFTEEVEIVADWALANNVPFEVVHDGSKLPKATDEYVEAAVRESKVANVSTGIIKILEKADQHPKLFVFWDEEDEDGYEAFETAWDAEIGSYDLCNGLEELSFSDDDDATEPEVSAEEVEEEVEPEEAVADEPKHDVDPKAELRRKTAKELKEICAEKGITVSRSGKGRIAKDAYIDALAEYEATGATEFHQDEDRVKGVEEKAKEGLVSKDEAVADLDDEEPEVEDDGQIPEAVEDDAPELPSDDDDEDVIEQRPGDLAVEGEYGVTSSSSGTSNPAESQTTIVYNSLPASAVQPFLTGQCGGCGGPIFSDGSTADFFHADKCPLG